jgi:hypothetical protein
MLPEGPPTIANIEGLRAQIKADLEAEKADPASVGWPDNMRATIGNMIERVPSFLPNEPGRPAVVDRVAAREARDDVKNDLKQLDDLLEKRDEKDKRLAWKLASWTLDQMRKVLKYREKPEGGRRRTRSRRPLSRRISKKRIVR